MKKLLIILVCLVAFSNISCEEEETKFDCNAAMHELNSLKSQMDYLIRRQNQIQFNSPILVTISQDISKLGMKIEKHEDLMKANGCKIY